MSKKPSKPSSNNNPTTYQFMNATGSIRYPMTNDYIFRIVLQKNEISRKALIRDLLHLEENEVISAEVTNPIDPGDSAQSKETRMDIRVILNHNAHLDIEMQVVNYNDWPERSLTYLSREFNSLKHGEDYKDIPPVYHIAFLNFTLFPEDPEFYATYRMLNVKTGKVYSDKYTLSVIDLNHIDLATKEDRIYGIDDWARLLKADTWEEVKMITNGNNALASTAESIFLSNEDYNIRKVALEREEARLEREYKEKKIQALSQTVADQNQQLADMDKEIVRLKELLATVGINP